MFKRKNLFEACTLSSSQFMEFNERKGQYSSNGGGPLMDIEFFKQTISLHYQHVYASKKWQNWFYRLFFFLLGVLFLILGLAIASQTVNFACSIYFRNCEMIKMCIEIFCFFLSASAFIIGWLIHPEKDAMQYLMKKIEKELDYPTKDLQMEYHAIISNLSQEQLSA